MKPSSAILFAGLTALACAPPALAAQADRGVETVLHVFTEDTGDGWFPVAGMVDLGGTLYGSTTYGGGSAGTVFAIDPGTGTESIVYSFCAQPSCTDGAYPNTLISLNGKLYGTTEYGGIPGKHSDGGGTVFSLEPNTGAETILYAFPPCGNPCWRGGVPQAGVTYANGGLYGTVSAGGANSGGLIFAIDLKTGKETRLYPFCSEQNCADGQDPQGMISVNGILYGTTYAGGAGNVTCSQYYYACGTVFSFNPATGAETVLHSFCSEQNCMDGGLPGSGLISVNGMLYGTASGGNSGGGVVFAIDPNTGAETIVHSFKGSQTDPLGDGPESPLTWWKGKLYGATYLGGAYAAGILFALDPATGKIAVLHTFGNTGDGREPDGGLLADHNTLYGTTTSGKRTCKAQRDDCGTIFSWKP